jgi:hypothetical protein
LALLQFTRESPPEGGDDGLVIAPVTTQIAEPGLHPGSRPPDAVEQEHASLSPRSIVRVRVETESAAPVALALVTLERPSSNEPVLFQGRTNDSGELTATLEELVQAVFVSVSDPRYLPVRTLVPVSSRDVVITLHVGCRVEVRLAPSDFQTAVGGQLVFQRDSLDGQFVPSEQRTITNPIVDIGRVGKGGIVLLRAGAIEVDVEHSRFAVPISGDLVIDFVSAPPSVGLVSFLVGSQADRDSRIWLFRGDHAIDRAPIEAVYSAAAEALVATVQGRLLPTQVGLKARFVFIGQSTDGRVCSGEVMLARDSRIVVHPRWEPGTALTCRLPDSAGRVSEASLWLGIGGEALRVSRSPFQLSTPVGLLGVRGDDIEVGGGFLAAIGGVVSDGAVRWTPLPRDTDYVVRLMTEEGGTLFASGNTGGGGHAEVTAGAPAGEVVEVRAKAEPPACGGSTWMARVRIGLEGPNSAKLVRSRRGSVMLRDLVLGENVRVDIRDLRCGGFLEFVVGSQRRYEVLLAPLEMAMTTLIITDESGAPVVHEVVNITVEGDPIVERFATTDNEGRAQVQIPRGARFVATMQSAGFVRRNVAGTGGDTTAILAERFTHVLVRNMAEGRDLRIEVQRDVIPVVEVALFMPAGGVFALGPLRKGTHRVRAETLDKKRVIEQFLSVDPLVSSNVIELR